MRVLQLLPLLAGSLAQQRSFGSCQFSRDCQTSDRCMFIADASCVCNFGQCIISGSQSVFFRGTECSNYTDCACKNHPGSCFCRNGFCQEFAWECHEGADCKELDKCKYKDCICSGNLCQFDCASDADCSGFPCNNKHGYKCKCEHSLCEFKKKDRECASIVDCVNLGLCEDDQPCACKDHICTRRPGLIPRSARRRNKTANCRTNQDCADTILKCQGDKCNCRTENSWFRSVGNCMRYGVVGGEG